MWFFKSNVRLDSVNISDNNCRGLHILGSSIMIYGTVVINNNYAIEANGGGILLDCTFDTTVSASELRWTVESRIYIQNNRAGKKGEGIYIGNKCLISCPIIITENVPHPIVMMVNNTAKIAGNSIYGGRLDDIICIYNSFWNTFSIAERNSSLAISSLPRKVCICSLDFPHIHACKVALNTKIFRGQTFKISLMCVGQLEYPSSCSFRAEVITDGIEIAHSSTNVQKIGLQCKKFSYTIKIRSRVVTNASLAFIPDTIHYSPGAPEILLIQLSIDKCPLGFITEQGIESLICTCSEHLHKEGIICSIDKLTLYKTATMWVGNYSGDITVHKNCPLGYCKIKFTAVNPFNQQDQCAFNRSNVLCGACQPGLSLVLGTSQCKQCSNLYLLLLIPFALAGVLLVLLLLKCNLTVSTGTINGLIFYANIVQATKTAFFPNGSNSTFIHILSVFIAWLNLDLGIETCFIQGLNTYYRTWLQFVFPLYIWSLVGLIILISRYSITISKWTGSNTVQVLATLFLLSYAKLLRVTIDVFSNLCAKLYFCTKKVGGAVNTYYSEQM